MTKPHTMPELPEPAHRGPTGTGAYFDSYTADQMRARDAMWAERLAALQSAQPAGHSCVFHAAPLTPGETRGPQFAVCAICGQPPRVLATQPAAPQGVIAWAHPDGRVVPASTKEHSSRDGGAMASSLAGYTIPCVAAQPAAAVSDAEIRHDANLPFVEDEHGAEWVTLSPAMFARAVRRVLALRPAQPAQAGEREAFERAALAKWGLLDFERSEFVPDMYHNQRLDDAWKGFGMGVAWLRASLPTQPAAQTDSMGMPTSCGKPLCSPDEHHPLCKAHQPAAQEVTSAHITWDAEGRRMLNGRLAPEHATISDCDRVCWVADGMQALGTVVRRHANDPDMVLVEIVSGRHWVHISCVYPMETKQATPEPLTLGPLAKRNIYDAIRGAYDLGYNDARNARTVPGDSAPGYDGRIVEEDHGSALFNLLSKRLKPATPEPVGEQITSEMLAAGRKAIHETLGASSAGIARCVYESMRAAQATPELVGDVRNG